MAITTITAAACSWSNVEVNLGLLGPLSLPTMKKIEYGSKVVPAYAYGAGKKPYDRTEGTIEIAPVKLEIGVSDWIVLLPLLVTYGALQPTNIANGAIFTGFNARDILYAGGTQFSLGVSYNLLGALLSLSDTLKGCRITDISMAPAQGNEPIMVNLEMSCLDVQSNVL